MRQNTKKLSQIIGWILFVFAIGFFCLQMGFLFVHERFQIEYIDNRLFYIINIACLLSLTLAILLLVKLTKTFKIIGSSIVGILVILHVVLMVESNQEVNNITSISPGFKNVFSVKEDVESGEAIYYRAYYGILGRPREMLPQVMDGNYKVEWLANDVAAFTYETSEDTIDQFIGTYGDRRNGTSYYYVGGEIQGVWRGDHIEIVSNTEGISVRENGETDLFPWENIEQYGTLAVVLRKNGEAQWTISLDENFEVHSDASQPTTGNITVYKATMEDNDSVTLDYVESVW